MKKSVNPTDQLFKDTFETASDPVDQEALWPFVEQNLPANEPSKGFFFYFLSALILLLLTLAAWAWMPDKSASLALPKQESAPLMQTQVSLVNTSQLPQKEASSQYPRQNYSSLHKPAFDRRKENLLFTYGKIQKRKETNLASSENQNENQQISGFQHVERLSSPLLNSIQPIHKQASIQLDGPGDPSWSRCSDKRASRPGFLIEGFAFGGIPMISNRLNDNTEFGTDNYLSTWNQSETAVSTFSAGLLIGLETQWGGSISAGLEYQKIQNRLNQEQRIIERITVYDEMAYFFIDSNNNRVYVADSVTTSRTYTRELQTAKTHTLINIPILLGYHRQMGKFRYGIIGGVNVHLRNEFKGKALDASGQIIDASSDSPNAIYRKDLNMSIIGGIDAGYMIGEGLEFYLSPRFRFQGDSWLRSDHPLISRIQLMGLQAGVRLHL